MLECLGIVLWMECLGIVLGKVLDEKSWQPWSNMTIMLCHGMIMVIHTHQGVIMARSWHDSYVFPTRVCYAQLEYKDK